MKLILIAGLGLLLGGCALFGGGHQRAAALKSEPAPLAASQSAASGAFRPAYATGRPVALVPCRQGVKLTEDCSGSNNRHQLGDDPAEDAGEPALTAVSVIPVRE